MDVDFDRERAWWDAKAPKEERGAADEAINRALRWREIEQHLGGVRSILEVGGGTGAFAIPLARRGFEVTVVDLSPAMLDLTRQKAPGLGSLHLVEGNAVDLSRFPDRAFDLVLNMDGAISFCGSRAEEALRESCRVTGGTLVITVSHRARLAVVWAEGALALLGRLSPAVYAMLERGEWRQDQFPENPQLTRGATQDYTGPLHGFLPGEVRAILEDAGLQVLRCGGLGSLAGLCEPSALEKLGDEDLFREFVALCARFDAEVLPDGPGTRQRAGLIAVARRWATPAAPAGARPS